MTVIIIRLCDICDKGDKISYRYGKAVCTRCEPEESPREKYLDNNGAVSEINMTDSHFA